MKNLFKTLFFFLLVIIITLFIIIMGYPVSKINHSSLSDEPNKDGLNFCVKEKRKYTRLLAMNLEMKDIYLNSEYQFYLKSVIDGKIILIKDIPKNFNMISICYLPKRDVWLGIAIDSINGAFTDNYKVVVCSNNQNIKIMNVKTSGDFKHPIKYKYPGDLPFEIDFDLETLKYLSPEEKVEILNF